MWQVPVNPGAAMLVTGGTGLLGLHWSAACREGYAVTRAIHRRDVRLPGTKSLSLDLADPHALDLALADGRISCVVHTAGLTSVEACERDPEAAEFHNVTVATSVAAAAERAGAQLVHISTDHLFDGKAELYHEDSPVSPVNVYGYTKAKAEEAVLRAHPRALVLRTNFYGWGPSHRASFSDWLLQALRSNQPLRLFNDVRYTPTHITPLIDAALRLLSRQDTGLFHAVGDDALSKYDFGQHLARVFGLSPTSIEVARLADQTDLVRRPLSMALSTNRIRSVLGGGLGGISEHLRLLKAQEKTPAIMEIRNL